MDTYGELASSIREIVNLNKLQQSAIFTAKVEKVEDCVCTVRIGGELSISNVRLKSVINQNPEQLFIKPQKGSYVLVADLSNGNFRDLAVISYSEIEEIKIKIGSETTIDIKENDIKLTVGNSKIDINNNEIKFNGGNQDGLVFAKNLVTRLNALEKRMTSHQHTYVPTPQSTGITSPDTASNPTITSTTVKDLENNKIKQ